MAELDPKQLQGYRDELGSASAELALRSRDLIARDGDLTVAAYLLFAERPQMHYPSAYVRVLKYADVERGAGRHQTLEKGRDFRCEGSIPKQVAEATRAIDERIPRRQSLGETGRFDGAPIIPKDVWVEGLVNAVVHRSYSIGGDHIRIEIFPNRIEISSPGRFPGLADPTDPDSISRHARNPRIARICAHLGITQELGEGIRRTSNGPSPSKSPAGGRAHNVGRGNSKRPSGILASDVALSTPASLICAGGGRASPRNCASPSPSRCRLPAGSRAR